MKEFQIPLSTELFADRFVADLEECPSEKKVKTENEGSEI
jgi:hypothetical protein